MNTNTATILSIKAGVLVPPTTSGTLGTQWWAITMSDKPDHELFYPTSAGVHPPFAQGQQINYTVGVTNGGKPKLIPQASAPEARQATPLPAQGGVSPQLQQPPLATARVEAQAQPATTQLPDNEVRHTKAKSCTFLKDWKMGDGATKYGYTVTFDNGESGTTWVDEKKPPFTAGQELSYSFDKMYGDGSKRIALAVTGSGVDKETFISNIACLNSAMTFIELRSKTILKQYGEDGMLLSDVFGIAKQIKQFATTNK